MSELGRAEPTALVKGNSLAAFETPPGTPAAPVPDAPLGPTAPPEPAPAEPAPETIVDVELRDDRGLDDRGAEDEEFHDLFSKIPGFPQSQGLPWYPMTLQAKVDHRMVRAAREDDITRLKQLIEEGIKRPEMYNAEESEVDHNIKIQADIIHKDFFGEEYKDDEAAETTRVVDPSLYVKANVNATTYMDRAPLHWAVSGGFVAVVRYLLKCQGINVNIKDRKGYTPLHLACFYGNKELVIALCEAGADPTIRDELQDTPEQKCTVTFKEDDSENSIARILQRAAQGRQLVVPESTPGQQTMPPTMHRR